MPTPITDATFDSEVTNASMVTVVDFWAPWCGPCRTMLPIFDELERDYAGKVKFVKMNVDENNDVPQKFGVMSIPTFIIFKGGKGVKTLVGTKSKEDMKKEIDAAMA